MKYVIWVVLAVGVLVAIPGAITGFDLETFAAVIAFMVLAALVGNVFKIASRVDEIAKRK